MKPQLGVGKGARLGMKRVTAATKAGGRYGSTGKRLRRTVLRSQQQVSVHFPALPFTGTPQVTLGAWSWNKNLLSPTW